MGENLVIFHVHHHVIPEDRDIAAAWVVYPWSTHRWKAVNTDSRPEVSTCVRCGAVKHVYNDVTVLVYDKDGNNITQEQCEFHQVSVVMDS